MQRDLKIGLSLAVLLIGVVGALFFRRDDTEAADIPDLKMAWEIDQQIMERKGHHIPYLANTQPPASSNAASPSTFERTPLHHDSDLPETTIVPTNPPQRFMAESRPPRAEITDLLPPHPDAMETLPSPDSEVIVADVPQDPEPGSPETERPIAGINSPAADLVQADRRQTLTKRWTNDGDRRIADSRRNQGWDPVDRPERDRPERIEKVPEPIPLPPLTDEPHQSEPPTPKATRKLKPIPITESGKFSRPGKTPFTLRPSSSDDAPPNGREPEMRERRTETAAIDRDPSSSDSGRIYVVQPGDTLERIAYKHYGRRDRVEAILEANRELISDPHLISIGMKLRLP